MDYALLKHIHQTLAVASISFFILRGVWMMRASPVLQRKPVRIVPHVIDTLFLLSGLGLVFILPVFSHAWLGAKLLGLVLYILLGLVALRLGRTQAVRSFAFIGAIIAFGWVASVAISKSPWGFLSVFMGGSG